MTHHVATKIYILGASAQGCITAEILRAQGGRDDPEFIDDNKRLWGTQINGIRVVGGFDYLEAQNPLGIGVIVAIGNPPARLALALRVGSMGIPMVNAIHPAATVMPSARLGCNVTVHPGAVINSNSLVGNHVLVNTSAIIEHDCVLEDGVTVCSGALLGGRVRIGCGAFIGTGAIVLPRNKIGAGSVVAAGAIVTKEIPSGVLVMGVPAGVVEEVDEAFDWGRLL